MTWPSQSPHADYLDPQRGNIQDLIDKCNQQGKTIPERQILTLFRDICISVQVLASYRNRAGVSIPWAHRDIKPA